MRKITSILLAFVLALTLMPTAWATEGRSNILLGTSGLEGAGVDHIYFGTYIGEPVEWRVLDTSTNIGSEGLFLLSDAVQCRTTQDYIAFDDDSNAWQGSDAQNWCKAFYNGESAAFSTLEQAAVLATSKNDAAFKTDRVSFADSDAILNNDHVFCLSAEEAMNTDYGFTNNTLRVAKDIENYSALNWWLRSADTDEDTENNRTAAGMIYGGCGYDAYDGMVISDWIVDEDNDANKSAGVRPAFNLDKSAVLMTTAASYIKPTTADGTLTSVGTATGNEWKLTLTDSSRSFNVTETAVTATAGSTVTLNYTGANEDEVVSVLLVSGNNVLYYGHADITTSGKAIVTVPNDLAVGSYTLKVFSEQCNSGNETDYASNVENVVLTVAEEKTSATTDAAIKTTTTVSPDKTVNTITSITASTDAETTVNIIDVSAYDGGKATKEVSVSKDVLGTVVKTEATKPVEFKVAANTSVTFNTEAVKSIAGNMSSATEATNVTLVVTPDATVNNNNEKKALDSVANSNAQTVELKLVGSESTNLFPAATATNARATVTVPFTMPAGNNTVNVYYLNATTGAAEYVGTAAVGSGTATFTVSHFSSYVLVPTTVSTGRHYSAVLANKTADTTTETKSSPKTFDAGVGIYAVSAILSVTGMAWVGRKKF